MRRDERLKFPPLPSDRYRCQACVGAEDPEDPDLRPCLRAGTCRNIDLVEAGCASNIWCVTENVLGVDFTSDLVQSRLYAPITKGTVVNTSGRSYCNFELVILDFVCASRQ